MNRFFVVLFLGLVLVFGPISLIWGAGVIWATWQARPPTNDDGSINDGLMRKIVYTASEEEDIIDSAIEALPRDLDSHITAKAYIVKDLNTGKVWTEHESTRLLPMASLAKLVTAAVTKRNIRPDKQTNDLLYPLLMISSNDAAEALARRYGRVKFIKAMNDLAQEIGAYRTYFVDPTGLSKSNVTTASDMSLIVGWLYENHPDLLDITRLKTKTIGRNILVNPTHFLSWSYYVGGKNGFTDAAGRTSASLFRLGYNKDLFAVVVLGSDNRDADVVRLIGKVK